jgi:hypothetical protein
MGNSFIEQKMQEEKWELGDEHVKFKDGPFAGIKFIQTVAVPEDCILIHPFVFGQILNNSTKADGYIDIIKHTKE